MKKSFLFIFLLFCFVNGCIEKETEPELVELNYVIDISVRNEGGQGEYPISSLILQENSVYIEYIGDNILLPKNGILLPKKYIYDQEFRNIRKLGAKIRLFYGRIILFEGKWPSYFGKPYYDNHPITIHLIVERDGTLRKVWMDENFKGKTLKIDYKRKKGYIWSVDVLEAYQQYFRGKKPRITMYEKTKNMCISEILPIAIFPVENMEVIVPEINIMATYGNFSIMILKIPGKEGIIEFIENDERKMYILPLNSLFKDIISENTKLIIMYIDIIEKKVFIRILNTSFLYPEKGWFGKIELKNPKIIEITVMELI